MNNVNTDSFVSNIRNHMRQDTGIGNNVERQIEQITWILFLKVYHYREIHWAVEQDDYHSIIPKKYQWNNWASNTKQNWNKTGDWLVNFVNKHLIPDLRSIKYDVHTSPRKAIVPEVFSEITNYMHDGILLRKVIDDVDELNLSKTDSNGNDIVSDIYEKILDTMQAHSDSGEYYTPRPLTDFITKHLHIKLGDKIGDLACGTGGFLTSSLKILHKEMQNNSSNSYKDIDIYNHSIYGQELIFRPFLLCVTNLFLHNVDNPNVIKGDSLSKDITTYTPNQQFDVICMNPPYGQNQLKGDKDNFPLDLYSGEMSDLFIDLVMYRLKPQGRAGLVLPNSFMFGEEDVKQRIKAKLFHNFNVKLIVRLPMGVFTPYTPVSTNMVFFDNTHPTQKTWFYRVDVPKGMKNFTKKRPIQHHDFDKVNEWLKNPHTIKHDDKYKAIQVPIDEIVKHHYYLEPYASFHQYKNKVEDPITLLNNYFKQDHKFTTQINALAKDVKNIIRGNHND